MTEKAILTLENTSNIGTSEALAEELETHILKGSNLEIDASKVEKVDTSLLQLLVAASNTLKKQDLELTIQNPSDCFSASAELMGLTKYLSMHNDSLKNGELQ